jgi:hypothetical protein
MRLHIPEEAEKTLWLTRVVAEHVQGKYGTNVVYGWFEDWLQDLRRDAVRRPPGGGGEDRAPGHGARPPGSRRADARHQARR